MCVLESYQKDSKERIASECYAFLRWKPTTEETTTIEGTDSDGNSVDVTIAHDYSEIFGENTPRLNQADTTEINRQLETLQNPAEYLFILRANEDGEYQDIVYLGTISAFKPFTFSTSGVSPRFDLVGNGLFAHITGAADSRSIVRHLGLDGELPEKIEPRENGIGLHLFGLAYTWDKQLRCDHSEGISLSSFQLQEQNLNTFTQKTIDKNVQHYPINFVRVRPRSISSVYGTLPTFDSVDAGTLGKASLIVQDLERFTQGNPQYQPIYDYLRLALTSVESIEDPASFSGVRANLR